MLAWTPSSSKARRQRGFTLIELIVVLVIIATVAGLVIPAVATLGRSTDMAASAKTQQDLAGNLQNFFVLQKRFPQGMDSLLIDSTGSPGSNDGAPDGLYLPVVDPAGNQVSGMTTSNPGLVNLLALGTLTASQRRSFTRCGFEYVFDHEVYDPATGTGEVNANNSAIFQRILPGSGGMPAAVLDPTLAVGLSPTSGAYIILRGLVPAELFPNATTPGTWDWIPEAGTQIVAMGVGNRCRLVPTTMLNTPVYPGNEGSYYGRYIAFFKVFPTGERAALVGVSDCYGRTGDYTIQQFNESLPNGARQG